MINRDLSFSEGELLRVSHVVTDECRFALLYELAYAEEPMTLAQLSRTFGADPREVGEILRALGARGVIGKRGQSYFATRLGSRAIRFLEQAFINRPEQAVESVSGETGVTTFGELSSGSHTNDGVWVSDQVIFRLEEKHQRPVAAATQSTIANVSSPGTEGCNTRSPSYVTT